ncbi:MAG: hypothetical protein ACMUIE_09470 [Thermoplasmatota archaeon]
MDRSGAISKALIAVLILAALVLSGIVFTGTVQETQAAKSSEKDGYGYYYVDNKDPNPKVDYNWINAVSTGTELPLSGYYDVEAISLDFTFNFYGTDYTTVYTCARGIVWFDYYSSSAPSGYSSSIPDSSLPYKEIRVCFGYPWTDEFNYGGVHYVTGTDSNGNDWVCIEWNNNYYDLTYQVILSETGLIKMQYNDVMSTYSSSYNNGNYHSVGIADDDGGNYVSYSQYNQANLENQLAIEYSTEEVGIANFKLEDGDGPYDHTAYAEHRFYEFSFDVFSTGGFSDLSLVRVYFGDPSQNIYVILKVGGGGWEWEMGGGNSNASLYFDKDLSYSRTDLLLNNSGLKAVFFVNFKFAVPFNGNSSITIWARGQNAPPSLFQKEDAFYLDSVVKLHGELTVLNEKGRVLKGEDFTMEKENITFTGVKLTYNTTMEFFPPSSAFFFQVTDDELITHYDMNSSGRNMSIWFVMPGLAVRKQFFPALRTGFGTPFPPEKLIGELSPIAFRVDDSKPIAPASVVLRADSFKDSQRDVDNDNIIYVSWSSVSDSGSGVKGYKVWTSYDPFNPNIPLQEAKTTQFVWENTTEGVFRIYVWAEDGVGHSGDFQEASIKIDKKLPFFVDFSPDLDWFRTLTPELTIFAKDNLTVSDGVSGVRPSTIEYSISTSGQENFEEWISADLYDDETLNPEDSVPVRLTPRFVEGTENFIRYRAKDYAGNGYAYSEEFNLKVDVTPVDFVDFFPTVNVWHDLDVVMDREVSVYLVDETSGVRTTQIYYRIADSYDAENDEYNWVTGVPQQNGWDKLQPRDYNRIDGNRLIWVHFEYDGFEEGDQNFIQFMVKDEAGNGNYRNYFNDFMTLSPMYQVNVNTQPVAIITSPTPLQRFEIRDLITFDASDSHDFDVDEGNLKFEWYVVELNKSLGYDEVLENIRFETTGFYNITLYVGDSVHRLDPYTGEDTRSVAKVRIEIYRWIPRYDIDTDGDGMSDGYEYDHLLDPFDPSDKLEDADRDGFVNFDEFLAGTDPWNPASKPPIEPMEIGTQPKESAPFGLWVFMVILVAAIVIGAVVIVIGYLRIHRTEQKEKTEEAEEEAMLATPQLDIPIMPPQIPMVDASIPTLPPPEQSYDQSAALPPAPEQQQMDMQEPPAPEPIGGETYPQPDQTQQEPQQEENPLYQEQYQQGQNPLYDGQQ